HAPLEPVQEDREVRPEPGGLSGRSPRGARRLHAFVLPTEVPRSGCVVPCCERSPVLPADATNVLVCLRYGIGDVVMELPVLAALRDALPGARVTALAAPPAHELLQGDPHLDRVVPTSRWALRHRWDEGSVETRARIRRWVREQGFDLVLDARQA